MLKHPHQPHPGCLWARCSGIPLSRDRFPGPCLSSHGPHVTQVHVHEDGKGTLCGVRVGFQSGFEGIQLKSTGNLASSTVEISWFRTWGLELESNTQAKSQKFKRLHYTCITLWGQSVVDTKGYPIRRENYCLWCYSLLTFIVKKKFNLFEPVSTSLYPSLIIAHYVIVI